MSDPEARAESSPVLVPLRRSAPRPAPFNPPPAQEQRPTTQTIRLRKPRGPIWPHDIPELADKPEPWEGVDNDVWQQPNVAHAFGTITVDPRVATEMTPSELQTFANCPHQFYWKYFMGLKQPRIQVAPEGMSQEDFYVRSQSGEILHDYFARHQFDWSPTKRWEELCHSVRRKAPIIVETPERFAEELMPQVSRFVSSEQYERMRSADEVLREWPITFRFGGATPFWLEGRPDVMFRQGRIWYLLDYKTQILHETDNTVLEVLEDTKRHELQAALYLIALRKLHGKHFVGSFTFFYTGHGIAVEDDSTDAWLDGWEALLPSIVRWIRLKNFGGAPRWTERKCARCPYRGLMCTPAGDPLAKQP